MTKNDLIYIQKMLWKKADSLERELNRLRAWKEAHARDFRWARHQNDPDYKNYLDSQLTKWSIVRRKCISSQEVVDEVWSIYTAVSADLINWKE